MVDDPRQAGAALGLGVGRRYSANDVVAGVVNVVKCTDNGDGIKTPGVLKDYLNGQVHLDCYMAARGSASEYQLTFSAIPFVHERHVEEHPVRQTKVGEVAFRSANNSVFAFCDIVEDKERVVSVLSPVDSFVRLRQSDRVENHLGEAHEWFGPKSPQKIISVGWERKEEIPGRIAKPGDLPRRAQDLIESVPQVNRRLGSHPVRPFRQGLLRSELEDILASLRIGFSDTFCATINESVLELAEFYYIGLSPAKGMECT